MSSKQEKSQALALGLGSFFNHSTEKQNVGWTRHFDKQCISYVTLRDIEPNEELCINYGRLWFDDVDGNTSKTATQEDDILSKIELID